METAEKDFDQFKIKKKKKMWELDHPKEARL
jgi:hypothetical protein